MTVGHKFLKDTFNITPTIGWHIDPFGHQASSAALFSQMGKFRLLIQRIQRFLFLKNRLLG
jgi:hypothetical protein